MFVIGATPGMGSAVHHIHRMHRAHSAAADSLTGYIQSADGTGITGFIMLIILLATAAILTFILLNLVYGD